VTKEIKNRIVEITIANPRWAVETLKWYKIKNRQDAIEMIMKVWDELPQAGIDYLVRIFQNRVRMVRESKGRSIQLFNPAAYFSPQGDNPNWI
jgi:hypothetical protein